MKQLWAFIKLTRPHFLLGGAVLYALGAVASDADSVGKYLTGQALVTAAQLTAHYVNEYADYEVDRHVANRTMFSGGSGVLSNGTLPRHVALRAAGASTVATVGLVAVVSTYSPTAAGLGLAALAVSWAYSSPPIRLLQTGWGEAATSLVVAVLVPIVGVAANGGTWSAQLGWTVATLFFLHMAMVLAFSLPDLESDAAAGKTVLAVRLGRRNARVTMAAFVVAASAVALVGVAVAATSLWPLALSAVPAVAMVASEYRQVYAISTSAAVATLMVFSVASLITLA